MKRLIFLTSLIILSTIVMGQVKFGLKLSPHVTWVVVDNKTTKTNGARVNLSYGLMMDYYFTDNYAFATEFGITTFGANLSVPSEKAKEIAYNGTNFTNLNDLSYNYKLQYITVPAIIRMRTKEIGYTRYYAEFGFGFGYLFRSKADVNFADQKLENMNINNPDPEDKFDILPSRYSDKVNNLRVSMIFGAGIQYNLFGNSLLVAGLRYDNGLNSFTYDDRWNSSLNFISLTAGVLF